ncbi:DNA methyltransferase [Burkholderia thailandensis]|nr:DNA methyltransferase [Burkholderia thailandensis]AOI50479.1 DNA methyltransferase [Burkholderia thailandensis]AOJ49517.1 DNA methyltransferase [Burkholderia thailandensis]
MDVLTLARMLPDASIDMVFTDLPYSSGGLHTSARTRPPSEKYINSGTKGVYRHRAARHRRAFVERHRRHR